MRTIHTGNGIVRTSRTPGEIARGRAQRFDPVDRRLFIDTFDRFRLVAPQLAALPFELDSMCAELTRHSAVMKAAMIEALASLRAEGVKL